MSITDHVKNNYKKWMFSTFDKVIMSFYAITFIFLLWYIFNSLASADLYSTGGFLVFNSIVFGSMILFFFYYMLKSQSSISSFSK
jgi:hypothetical protein